MSKGKECMGQAIAHIDMTVDLFYQQKLQEALAELDGVITDIMKAMDGLFQYREEHTEFSFDEQKLTEGLKEAMGALQEQDLVLLADVLQYEFREYLIELEARME